MAQALGIASDPYLVLELIADKLNERETPSIDKEVEEGLVSVIIIYTVTNANLPPARAMAARAFFEQFLAIIKSFDDSETFTAYWKFGLLQCEKFSCFGVESDHDHWIRVKAVDGIFTPETLWADLSAAREAQQHIVVSRRGEGSSKVRLRFCSKPRQPIQSR